MYLSDILHKYLDTASLQNVIQMIDFTPSEDKGEIIGKILHILLETNYDNGSEISRNLLRWIYESMNESSLRALLIEEGIPPIGDRQELFERFLFCIADDELSSTIYEID